MPQAIYPPVRPRTDRAARATRALARPMVIEMHEPAGKRFDHIDGLRALAVLSVVAYHTLLYAWPNGTTPTLVGCGARGVDLFFAISGFCLAYPVLRAHRVDGRVRIPFASFLFRRLSRIAPTYYVAIALFAGLAFTRFGLPTSNVGTSITPAGVVHGALLDALFATSLSPSLDSSFWTIGIEMRWYLVFPVVCFLFIRAPRVFAAVLAASYFIAWLLPVPSVDFGVLPDFLVGIIAAELTLAKSPICRHALPFAALTLGLAVFEQSSSPIVTHADPLWHLASFFLILASGTPVAAAVLRWNPVRFLGIASYSIYLVHQPILRSLEYAGLARAPSAAVAVLGGIAFYFGVERPLTAPRARGAIEDVLAKMMPAFGGSRTAATPTTSS